MWNPFRNQNKSKVVVKTVKSGPIRKIKYQIGVGTVLAVMNYLGLQQYLPAELYEPVAKFATELIALAIVGVGYYTNPSVEDGVMRAE